MDGEVKSAWTNASPRLPTSCSAGAAPFIFFDFLSPFHTYKLAATPSSIPHWDTVVQRVRFPSLRARHPQFSFTDCSAHTVLYHFFRFRTDRHAENKLMQARCIEE